MKIEIIRSFHINKWIYKVDTSHFVGKANFTFGLLMNKIIVEDGEQQVVYVLKEKNLFLKLIEKIILNIFALTYYHLYDGNGNLITKIKPVFNKPQRRCFVDGSIYEVRLHNRNYIKLNKDNREIAVYKKTEITEMEKNHYYVKCEDDYSDKQEIILLVCMLIDREFYPNDNKFSLMKRETSYVFGDK